MPLPPDLIALLLLRLSGSTELFNKAACHWRSCKLGACGTCSPCNRQQNNSVRSSSHLKAQSLDDGIQIVLGKPSQPKDMTWQHSHGVFPQMPFPESSSCGLLCVIFSKDQATSYQDCKEYLVTDMFSIFLNITSLEKASLCWRCTETISLISLLQIQDFLGRIRFT